jgi:hypothetical protein
VACQTPFSPSFRRDVGESGAIVSKMAIDGLR